MTVQWQPAALDLTGVDRAIVSGIVRLPAGGYLAWGHGQSDALEGADVGELYWRSDDGRVWERTAASGPARLSAADSSPLGIVAIAGGEAWWSEDGNRWTRGHLESPGGEPDLWDVAVGEEAAVVVGSGGAWISRDGLRWQPVTGERMDISRVHAVDVTRQGFIAVGEEWTGGGYEAHAWRISPDGGAWQRDPGGDLTGRSYDTLAHVWGVGDSALAVGTRGEVETSGSASGCTAATAATSGASKRPIAPSPGVPGSGPIAWKPKLAKAPRLGFAPGGPAIASWRDGLVAIGLDGASPLALHASTDGLRWDRSRPLEQLPDLGHGFITTFIVDGDTAIVSGTIEPPGDQSVQDYFLQVGTITP